MVDLTKFFESEFLSVEQVRASSSKIATVLYGGDFDRDRWGEYVWVLVEIDGAQKKLRLNATTFNNLKTWGVNTEGWIGKQIHLEIAPAKEGGKEFIIGAPAYKRVIEGLKK